MGLSIEVEDPDEGCVFIATDDRCALHFPGVTRVFLSVADMRTVHAQLGALLQLRDAPRKAQALYVPDTPVGTAAFWKKYMGENK